MDITFSFIPSNSTIPVILSLIKDNRDSVFSLFVDNYNSIAKDFNTLAIFLYKGYFLRVV
jgi:hypothetical protein